MNKLYYDPNTGIYYYFDEGTASYQFHSQVPLSAPAHTGQMYNGKGKGRASVKRKERRQTDEPKIGDERVRF